MTSTEVIVVSLLVGFAIGVAFLMVLWACKACLGLSKTKDDERNDAQRPQPVPAPTAAGTTEASETSVSLSLPQRGDRLPDEAAGPPVPHPAAQRRPGALTAFPVENVAPSPATTVPSPEPGPMAPSPYSMKAASPGLVKPPGATGPVASPSPMPTRLSTHAMFPSDPVTPIPYGSGSKTRYESSTSAASPKVSSTPVDPIESGSTPHSTPQMAPVRTPATSSALSIRADAGATTNAASGVATLAQLDPTLPAPTPSSRQDNAEPQAPMISAAPSAVTDASVDPPPLDGVPALNLDPITAARNARNAANPRSYALADSESVPGTTAEIGPMSEVAGLPHATSIRPQHAASAKMPQPLQPIGATKSLDPQTAASLAAAGGASSPGEVSVVPAGDDPSATAANGSIPLTDTTNRPPHGAGGTSMIAQYTELDPGAEMTVTVGDQTAAFISGAPRSQLNYVPQSADSHLPGARSSEMQDTSRTNSGPGPSDPAAAGDLPPGAVVRGRDPFLDNLLSSKLSREMSADVAGSGAPSPTAAGAPGYSPERVYQPGLGAPESIADSVASVPLAPTSSGPAPVPQGPTGPIYVPSDDPNTQYGGYGGGSFAGETSAMFSDASNWTLSNTAAFTSSVAPSSRMGAGSRMGGGSRTGGMHAPPGYSESMVSGVSGVFSEASDWTLSGPSRAIPPLRAGPGTTRGLRNHAFSPLPSPSTRSNMSNMGAGWSSRYSNWTLSGGNTGHIGASRGLRGAGGGTSRFVDDGRSLAFTDGGSEWALSPRSTLVRDDLDVGHSERWMQADEITRPARVTAETRGLRNKFEQKTLRQKYAADDANVPESAVRRVNEWMGDLGETRDEVVKRLMAQNDG